MASSNDDDAARTSDPAPARKRRRGERDLQALCLRQGPAPCRFGRASRPARCDALQPEEVSYEAAANCLSDSLLLMDSLRGLAASRTGMVRVSTPAW